MVFCISKGKKVFLVRNFIRQLSPQGNENKLRYKLFKTGVYGKADKSFTGVMWLGGL